MAPYSKAVARFEQTRPELDPANQPSIGARQFYLDDTDLPEYLLLLQWVV